MPYNKIFINLGNIGPDLFVQTSPPWARTAQKRPRFDIYLYRPRVQFIRSYYLLWHTQTSYTATSPLWARTAQKRPQFDISLYRPRVRLIRSYYLLWHTQTSYTAEKYILLKY